MLTRKDYERFARMARESEATPEMVDRWVDLCVSDGNPRFDEDRFREACRWEA